VLQPEVEASRQDFHLYVTLGTLRVDRETVASKNASIRADSLGINALVLAFNAFIGELEELRRQYGSAVSSMTPMY
jgi:hypothetical protein